MPKPIKSRKHGRIPAKSTVVRALRPDQVLGDEPGEEKKPIIRVWPQTMRKAEFGVRHQDLIVPTKRRKS